jgi:hypothetical protein
MDSQLVESVASRAEELEEASAEELAEELEERVAVLGAMWDSWLAWETAYLLVSLMVVVLGVLWGVSMAVVSGEMLASWLAFCSEI